MYFNQKIFAKDFSGLGTFSHEMTHANEKRIFGERREGQGPELYARGMFESEDGTRGKPNHFPTFLFATTTKIPESDNRTYPSNPLTDKDSLVNYSKNLIDLIAFLEAKEAKIALEMSDEDKKLYFKNIEQIERSAGKPGTGISTIDRFVRAVTAPQNISELVKNGFVSGQFAADIAGIRFRTGDTNAYDSVSLFDSFYAANVAAEGKNTVGDWSFKRNAHEIIGWFGWDAFVTYISNKSSDDRDAFVKILQGKYNNDYQDFKAQKYKELLEKIPKDDFFDLTKLERDLSEAIRADLEIIKNADQNNISSIPSAKNVRDVKQKILTKALQYNELRESVLSDKIESNLIYVATNSAGKGDGSDSNNPIGGLENAMLKAKEEGSIIKIVGNVQIRDPLSLDKNVTIEGENNDSHLNLNDNLIINKNVVFKNLRLSINNDSSVPANIVINAESVTFDRVNTAISTQQKQKRPNIFIEGPLANLKIINANDTIFDNISINSQGADVTIAENVKIREKIMMNADSTIRTASNFVNNFESAKNLQTEVIFS